MNVAEAFNIESTMWGTHKLVGFGLFFKANTAQPPRPIGKQLGQWLFNKFLHTLRQVVSKRGDDVNLMLTEILGKKLHHGERVIFWIILCRLQRSNYGRNLLLIFMSKIHPPLVYIFLCILISCDGSTVNKDGCYECTTTFVTTGSANDHTTESKVLKCDVTEEDIREMERLAVDTIKSPDGVVVTTKAQCNKL